MAKNLELPWQGVALFSLGVATIIALQKFVPAGDLRENLMSGAGSLCMLAMWFVRNPTFGGKPLTIPPPPPPVAPVEAPIEAPK